MVNAPPRRRTPSRITTLAAGEAGIDIRGLVGFYVIAYLLSWGWTIPMAVAGWEITKGDGWPTHFPALAGPLLATVAVTVWRGRQVGVQDLVRRMFSWRASWPVWAAALSPLVFLGIALIGIAVTGGDLPSVADFGLFSGLPAIGVVGVFLLITVVNGFGEETGWRGYALVQLQRRFSPAVATVIVTALWALWHVPYFFVLAAYQDFAAFELVGFVLGIMAGAFILTMLYNRSGGSILLPVIWHGVYNLVGATAAAVGTIAAVVTTLVMVHGGTLIWMEVQARRKGSSVIGPIEG